MKLPDEKPSLRQIGDPLKTGDVVYQHMHTEDREVLARLATDFRYFAYHCLWVVDKEGNLVRFRFNDAQEYLHKAIEDMLLEVGYVRMIILKGRQQGMSTYVIARLYWIAITREHKSICVLSHDKDSVARLFKKVETFHENMPDLMRLKTKEDNKFAVQYTTKSSFFILTAGSGNAGRGATSQYRLESERAFFENVKQTDSGIGQSTADVEGTEVYRESTANGNNHFRKEFNLAKSGEGKWRCVFIPWYWQREYTTPPKMPFKLTDEEVRLQERFGLTLGQLQWRRDKIHELDDIKLFKQEYPLTPKEAFQSSGESHFESELVDQALYNKSTTGVGPVVIGCDPAGAGDRTVIVMRRGREMFYMRIYRSMTGERLQKILGDLIDQYSAVKCFIDMGYGHDVVSGLRSAGYEREVVGVHFQQQAGDTDMYSNKRTEMLFSLRRWLRDQPCAITCANSKEEQEDIALDFASIPEADISGRTFSFKPKKEIKKESGRSPDIVDAMMLTLAFPVKDESTEQRRGKNQKTKNTKNGSVMSGRRQRAGKLNNVIPFRRNKKAA